MQAVLLRNSQSEFGRYKIDTGGEVCHLQATIRHLRTAQMFKQFPKKDIPHGILPSINENIPLFQRSFLFRLYYLFGLIGFLILNHQDTHFIKKIKRNSDYGQRKRVARRCYDSSGNNDDYHCVTAILA